MSRTKSPELNMNEFVSIFARGAIIHFERASIRLNGNEFVMEGPSGHHTLDADITSLERLNAHWVPFAMHSQNAYPRITIAKV